MGALRKLLPITAITFIVGWLAIAGVPPFAGFWSKDEILLFAYDKSPVLYAVGLVTALLTAYYMTRQVIMVFYGKAHWHDAHEQHGAAGDYVGSAAGDFTPHESPKTMLFPLVMLAGLALVGGIIQLPSWSWIPSSLAHRLENWLGPIVHGHEHELTRDAHDLSGTLALVAVGCAVVGITAAVLVYAKHKVKPIEPKILADGWGYDRAVSWVMGNPGRRAFDGVAWADAKVIDGAVDGTGALVRKAAGQVRKLQSGNVRNYAAAIGAAVVLLLLWFVVGRGIL